eukprot:4464864-Pleurochrysis_carterae.AAC.1
MEVCHRSHKRKVLEVSFNLHTLNDLGAQRLPPAFPYATGKDLDFKLMVLGHVRELARRGAPMSRYFMQLAAEAKAAAPQAQ